MLVAHSRTAIGLARRDASTFYGNMRLSLTHFILCTPLGHCVTVDTFGVVFGAAIRRWSAFYIVPVLLDIRCVLYVYVLPFAARDHFLIIVLVFTTWTNLGDWYHINICKNLVMPLFFWDVFMRIFNAKFHYVVFPIINELLWLNLKVKVCCSHLSKRMTGLSGLKLKYFIWICYVYSICCFRIVPSWSTFSLNFTLLQIWLLSIYPFLE